MTEDRYDPILALEPGDYPLGGGWTLGIKKDDDEDAFAELRTNGAVACWEWGDRTGTAFDLRSARAVIAVFLTAQAEDVVLPKLAADRLAAFAKLAVECIAASLVRDDIAEPFSEEARP